MPPHCDSLDGPVVNAARAALRSGDVTVVLPFVPETAEQEVRTAFARALETHTGAPASLAADVADLWFFETVVRLHRAGEGKPYTGLKPAGLDVGPAIPLAEEAIETGSAGRLEHLLDEELRMAAKHRLEEVLILKDAQHDLPSSRAYTTAMLGFQVWAHGVHQAVTDGGHHG